MDYRRVLTIQDISCVGQCSMTVALPILSACGQETCVLPAAVLSTHTGGFGAPVAVHLKDALWPMADHWKRAGIDFDGIYIGYLGSLKAVECAERIIGELLAPGGRVIVDPAMGDHGRLYSGLDEDYAAGMARLCKLAHVVLPNVTEAAMLAGVTVPEQCTPEMVGRLLEALEGQDVVLTGVDFGPRETGAAVRCGGEITFVKNKKVPQSYHGTGDIFASCFVGAWMSGRSMTRAAEIAADFTGRCIQKTYEAPAHWYGVRFEPMLGSLIEMLEDR